jgi:hypothetical protein
MLPYVDFTPGKPPPSRNMRDAVRELASLETPRRDGATAGKPVAAIHENVRHERENRR